MSSPKKIVCEFPHELSNKARLIALVVIIIVIIIAFIIISLRLHNGLKIYVTQKKDH